MTRTTTDLATMLTLVEAAGRAGIATLLWGDPGTGKSSLIRGLAKLHSLPCEVVYGSQVESSEFNGLPAITGDGVRLLPPAWARRLAESEDGGYLLLEELSTAVPSVQKSMLGTALDRTVGEIYLGRRTRVIAAANDPDSAADGWDLEPPLANRFLHIDYRPSMDEWLDGIVAGFPAPAIRPLGPLNDHTRALARATVATFIRLRGSDLLHAMPDDAHGRGRAWPSRRTWTMLADILAQTQDTDVLTMAATGLVGIGAGSELMTWLEHADLPDPQTVLDDPEGFDWDGLTPDRTWALLSGVVALSTATSTQGDWRKAWAPLAAAAEHGQAAVAATCARALMIARPAGAKPPAAAKRFAPVLEDAGLL